MESAEIEKKIAEIVGKADIEVMGADCDFTVTIISKSFEGLTPVKRQQSILAGFTEVLASGELHALTVKPYTPEEWNTRVSTASSLVQVTL